MPDWPARDGKRVINITVDLSDLLYLNQQAAHNRCSRAAYLRQLIVRDQERSRST
jgi:hypothetical protein